MGTLTVELLEIIPKLQILPDKGNKTLNDIKWKQLSLLNFLHTAILDFMTSLRCSYL